MYRNEVDIALEDDLSSGYLVSEALADLEILSKIPCAGLRLSEPLKKVEWVDTRCSIEVHQYELSQTQYTSCMLILNTYIICFPAE
jgi:hypothetical protein